MNQEKIIIECDCGSHILIIEKHETEVYLAMFQFGKSKRSFWKRLQLAWKTIWKDEYFSDQIVMNYEQSSKLEEFLRNVKEK